MREFLRDLKENIAHVAAVITLITMVVSIIVGFVLLFILALMHLHPLLAAVSCFVLLVVCSSILVTLHDWSERF